MKSGREKGEMVTKIEREVFLSVNINVNTHQTR
jgi:hypothetical protein